jgi:hypothetical protein
MFEMLDVAIARGLDQQDPLFKALAAYVFEVVSNANVNQWLVVQGASESMERRYRTIFRDKARNEAAKRCADFWQGKRDTMPDLKEIMHATLARMNIQVYQKPGTEKKTFLAKVI